jgi:indole-3-glycerol phosphate synthase
LDRIIAYKRDEVAARKVARSQSELDGAIRRQGPARGFVEHLLETPGPALIAEIKKASPSKGVIRADFDPPAGRASMKAARRAFQCLRMREAFKATKTIWSPRAKPAIYRRCVRTS